MSIKEKKTARERHRRIIAKIEKKRKADFDQKQKERKLLAARNAGADQKKN